MLLRHELQQLASALKATQEFARMTGLRKKIMGDSSMSRLMSSFEREHLRLLNLDLPEADASVRLKKLYIDYEGFLEKQDVKDYIKAVQNYQKMVTENIGYLNSLLDVNAQK